MNNFRFELSPVSRSKGKSAVGLVAYQTGQRFLDRRLGRSFNYSKRVDVVEFGLALPNREQVDLEKFWCDLEVHHKRGDAVVARDLKLSIPKELSAQSRLTLAVEMAEHIAVKYSIGVSWALHKPRYFSKVEIQQAPHQFWELDKEGRMTNSNWHVHMLLTACHVTARDQNFHFGNKCLDLDPISCNRARLENFASREREIWCNLVNSHLKSEQHVLRVDHKSYERRAVPKLPGRHLGSVAFAIERRTGRASEARKKEIQRQARLKNEQANLAAQIRINHEVELLRKEGRALIKEIKLMRNQEQSIRGAEMNQSASERHRC